MAVKSATSTKWHVAAGDLQLAFLRCADMSASVTLSFARSKLLCSMLAALVGLASGDSFIQAMVICSSLASLLVDAKKMLAMTIVKSLAGDGNELLWLVLEPRVAVEHIIVWLGHVSLYTCDVYSFSNCRQLHYNYTLGNVVVSWHLFAQSQYLVHIHRAQVLALKSWSSLTSASRAPWHLICLQPVDTIHHSW